MKTRVLVAALLLALGVSPALAGTSSYVVRDGNNSQLTFGATTDGNSFLYGNIAIVDGANASVKATVTGGNALKVDGSAVTQPVSGSLTVTQSAGGNLHVDCDAGCSSSPAPADESAFVAGTTSQSTVGGFFQTTATNNPLANGQMGAFQTTAQRALFENPRDSSGNELATSAHPLRIDPTGATTQPISGTVTANAGTGTYTVGQLTGSNLHMVCDAGCSSSTAPADEAAFTAGTTPQSPIGGFFQTTATNNALTTGQMGAFQVTANRALFVNLRNASGTEIGTASNAVRIDPVGTTTQPTQDTSDGPVAAGSAATKSGLVGCVFNSSLPAPSTTQQVAEQCDSGGRQITAAWADTGNMLRGAASTTAATATTLIAAQGASVKTYVASIQCWNSGASSSVLTIDDSASTTLFVPAGGGSNVIYQIPIATAANTALTFTPGTASTTIGCSFQGFKGA